ncbi:hypothetical protein J7E52_07850 [Bacillus sp. ISL-34]|uniref:hypothetical protein n=1 Tax=Bacillus sp. ISL-34 TaxID=2819121 RepID=UPI001BE743F1|nr:hypothetical protein [Bacillus sp. ISL-34]MBT2646635.1 hypothetical protein [Bacillus sp. ISL-34]
MNFWIPFQMIYMIIITLLLIYDFFPVFFLISFQGLFRSVLFKKDLHTDHGVRIKSQLFYTMYLLSLVGVLTALGGRSTVGYL